MDKTRRKILLSGAAALGNRVLPLSLGAPLAARTASASACVTGLPARIQFDPAPFTLGVASGDPTPNSVIIWTRFAPDPLCAQGGMTSDVTVWYAVATDPAFTIPSLVVLNAVTAKAAEGGTVHVDITGLNPDTVYYYMFWDAQQTTSVVGTTKTAPSGSTSSARFGLVSCQNIDRGRYGAFERMVNENLDFIIHCGDVIYESALFSNTGWPEELRPEPTDLESYRIRHAVYRGDPQLRAAYAAVPWIVTWDDHEFINDYWSAGGDGLSGTEFFERRAAAYQAYYEHMPIRPPDGLPDPQTGFRIHRQLVYGDLLDLLVLDTRQFRDQPTSEPNFNDPNRSMLGDDQKQWLKDRLSTSTAGWRGVVNSVPMMSVKQLNGQSAIGNAKDKWEGYAAERAELLDYIASNGIQNVVSLTGDVHSSLASNLKVDFSNAQAPNVATEFGGMSVTSAPPPELRELLGTPLILLGLYSANRHVRYLNALQRGYVVCDVTPQNWTSTYRRVNRDNPNAPAETLVRLRVNNGVAKINWVSGALGNPFPAQP